MTLCINPDIQFADNVVGLPLAQGNLYFGLPNQDPKTNPKQPFADENFSTPISATQALTDAGKPSASIFLNGNYSLLIEDQFGAQVRLIPSLGANAVDALREELADSDGADMIGYGSGTVDDMLDRLTAPVYVVFSTGQSNMPQAIGFSWSAPPNLYIWNFDANTQPSNQVGTAFVAASSTTVGPSVAAAAVLARENPGATIYVINIYRGGMGLVNWGPSPVDYDFREAITGNLAAALSAISRTTIDYFVWAGCESDANAQSQTITVDMETWLWQWLYTNSWFPPYTPSYVLGMSPYAQSAPGNGDYLWKRYNGSLRASCAVIPSVRKYIDYDEFPISLYDATGPIPYIHRTGEGYYKAGLKLGMCMLTGISESIIRSNNAGGTYTPTFDAAQFVNCTSVVLSQAKWWREAGTNIIKADGRVTVTVTAADTDTSFWVTVPVKVKNFPGFVNGRCASAQRDSGIVLPLASQQAVQVFFNSRVTGAITLMYEFSYLANSSDILPNSPPGTT